MTVSPAHPHQAERHSVGYTMGVIALIISMVGLSAAYGLGLLLQQKRVPTLPSDEGPRIVRTLVGKELDIPASWFRNGTPQEQGFASQIELRLMLPIGKGGALTPVDVTLLPLSRVKPSANLLDGVYLHAFTADQFTGPAGLIGKPLDGTDGFEDETVWYDALSSTPFVAKCAPLPAGHGAQQCLRTVALQGGIGAVYSFSADVLDNWRAFDPQMKSWLSRIGAM